MRLTFGKCLLLTPAFCCGSSHFEHLVQNETFSLLKEVGLVKDVTPSDEPSAPVVAPEVALGGHSADKTVASSLNSVEKTMTSIDCWMHRMAKQLSILEAERKRQMNSLTQVLNSIMEHYQQLQAHLMASGTLLISSFEEQPDVQTSLQKLREKVALFMDLCAETFTPFPHTYSGKDLIPQPIHGFISHVHQCPPVCDPCWEKGQGLLCTHIYLLQGNPYLQVTLKDDQEWIDLAPLGYTTYVCDCGQEHEYTYPCTKPVMLTPVNSAEESQTTPIPGYIAPDKTWHRLNTVWKDCWLDFDVASNNI